MLPKLFPEEECMYICLFFVFFFEREKRWLWLLFKINSIDIGLLVTLTCRFVECICKCSTF